MVIQGSGEAGEPWSLLVTTRMLLNSVTRLLVLIDLIVLQDQISVLILLCMSWTCEEIVK